MVMARTLLVSSLLLLGLAAPARAEMTWEYAKGVAVEYWAERGIATPCDPRPLYLTRAQEANIATSVPFIPYTFADEATCQVLITPLAEWHRVRNAYDDEYCAAVAHEFGNLAGQHGSSDGVMREAPNGGTETVPFGCAHPRQYKVLKGWREPPRWVRRSPARVERLWLTGRVWRARVARARWLERH